MSISASKGCVCERVNPKCGEDKLRRKLVANKERNWLLAVTLNSIAKQAANMPMTDLDQIIINAFNRHGFCGDKLKKLARLYYRMPRRREIFPGKFAEFNTQTEYTIADLKTDLPEIERAILSMPNVENIDVQAVHAGIARRRDFRISESTLREYGSGILRAVTPNVNPPNPKYTIKAHSFKCLEETSEWSASDEVYWLFGSLGKGIKVTTKSRVFNYVDAGEERFFDQDTGCIWGQNCLSQDFPEGEVGAIITLMEHDEGDPTEIQAGFAAAFLAAEGILTAVGGPVGIAIAAVLAALGPFIQWFLGFLADDHIADQTFIFTRQVIDDQFGKPKAGESQSFEMTRLFTDEDARYRLKIKLSRMS